MRPKRNIEERPARLGVANLARHGDRGEIVLELEPGKARTLHFAVAVGDQAHRNYSVELIEKLHCTRPQHPRSTKPSEVLRCQRGRVEFEIGVLDQQTEPFVIQRVESELTCFKLFPERSRETLERGEVLPSVGDAMICEECRKSRSLRRCEVRERVIEVKQDQVVRGTNLSRSIGSHTCKLSTSPVTGGRDPGRRRNHRNKHRNKCVNAHGRDLIEADGVNLRFPGLTGGTGESRVDELEFLSLSCETRQPNCAA